MKRGKPGESLLRCIRALWSYTHALSRRCSQQTVLSDLLVVSLTSLKCNIEASKIPEDVCDALEEFIAARTTSKSNAVDVADNLFIVSATSASEYAVGI